MDRHENNSPELPDLSPEVIQMLVQRVSRMFLRHLISLTYTLPVRVPLIPQILYHPELFQDQPVQDIVTPHPQPQLHTGQQVRLCRVICRHN
jgi:hypothetical protein